MLPEQFAAERSGIDLAHSCDGFGFYLVIWAVIKSLLARVSC